jgi:hypothetical protein
MKARRAFRRSGKIGALSLWKVDEKGYLLDSVTGTWTWVIDYIGQFKSWVAYFLYTDYVLILTKMGCATIWANFSQTHLVTLPGPNDFGIYNYVQLQLQH